MWLSTTTPSSPGVSSISSRVFTFLYPGQDAPLRRRRVLRIIRNVRLVAPFSFIFLTELLIRFIYFYSLLDQQVCWSCKRYFLLKMFLIKFSKELKILDFLFSAYYWYRETLNISPDVESPQEVNWTIGLSLLTPNIFYLQHSPLLQLFA